MNKKILFLDLDGTLLNDDKQIPEENKRALHWAVAQGHRVVIATGPGHLWSNWILTGKDSSASPTMEGSFMTAEKKRSFPNIH